MPNQTQAETHRDFRAADTIAQASAALREVDRVIGGLRETGLRARTDAGRRFAILQINEWEGHRVRLEQIIETSRQCNGLRNRGKESYLPLKASCPCPQAVEAHLRERETGEAA